MNISKKCTKCNNTNFKCNNYMNLLLVKNKNKGKIHNNNTYTIAYYITIGEYATTYNLKKSVGKKLLVSNAQTHMFMSTKASIIQKQFKLHIIRKINAMFGCQQRSKCINDSDFVTLEKLTEIPYTQFICYTDSIRYYGFRISSLYTYCKQQTTNNNPYTQSAFNINMIQHLLRLYYTYSLISDTPLILQEKKEELSICDEVFQIIENTNVFGNYIKSEWFMQLDNLQLFEFMIELQNIWQTSPLIYSNTFHEFNVLDLYNVLDMQTVCLNILKAFLTSNSNYTYQYATYVVLALSMFIPEIQTTFPWLATI